jgi:hypothetical protein
VAQFRVQHGSVGCSVLSEGAAWLSSGCGVVLFRMQCGSVRVRRGSVQGAAWIS